MVKKIDIEWIFTLLCVTLVAVCPYVVEGFSNPTFSVGPVRQGRATSVLKPNFRSQSLAPESNIMVKSSWLGAMKDARTSEFISDKSQVLQKIDADHFSIQSSMLALLKEEKTSILTCIAILSVATFGFPSTSLAIPAISELSSFSLSASTSSLSEWATTTGFYQAFSLVFLSEIGDKTFFIAGLLSMKTSRLISFTGSIGALSVMTVISCVIGQLFQAVPDGLTQGLPIDDYVAVAAFTFFGLKTLKEAIDSDPAEGNAGMDEEFADAEEAVETSDAIKKSTFWGLILSTFGLVFAAEFGDRSFLATIALSAAQNPFSVGAGAIAAHAIATGIAVLGGGVLAKYVSEKVIGYISGSLFLIFAITTALGLF